MKEDSEKAGLKLNIKKNKIMASGPITSWETDGEKMETGTDFVFLGSKITAVGDCSHEIKRHLLLWRKAVISLDSILKSRDITLPTKVHLVKVMIFPAVMYGCESWTIKKAESQRTDTFVVLEILESPLDCKEVKPVNTKGNQPLIFIGRTNVEAEGPKRWPADAKNWLTGKDPNAGKDWRQEEKGMTGWDGWMASPTWWAWVWVNSGSWWWTGMPGMLQSMGWQRVRHDWVTELN